MAAERRTDLRLGAFVLIGTVVLVLGLYLLGSKRDFFSSNIELNAVFHEVNGLRKGNNVRYAGIDVGTVKSIRLLNDTQLVVTMVVHTSAAEHIRRNALARIGSDGLMGNKIVSIEPGEGAGASVADGDRLLTGTALDTDAMLRTLGRSNENLAAITDDLRELSRQLNSSGSLLRLLSDSALVTDVRGGVDDLRSTAANARELTERLNGVVSDVQAGRGAMGTLINDPAAERQVRALLLNLTSVSDSLALITGRIGEFTSGLSDTDGVGYALTRDPALATEVRRAIANLDTSSATLSEDLRALQRNWFFRRYFKEKARDGR